MIYLDLILFAVALLLCWYGVFGEHMTAAEFRKEMCSVGEHQYTKPMRWLSLSKTDTPSVWMVSQHCAHCGNYKTWKETT